MREYQWDSNNDGSDCMLLNPFARGKSNAEPMIIRGAVNWRGMDLWNLTWLASQDMDVDVSILEEVSRMTLLC